MKEYHHDTPLKKEASSNRKTKLIDTPLKKPNHRQQKIKRNLSSAFTPINEDDDTLSPSEKQSIEVSESVNDHQSTVEIGNSSSISDHDLVSEYADVLQHPEQSIGISSVSEANVSNEDQLNQSVESCIVSSKQYISPASTSSGLGGLTPSSSSSASLITAAAFVNSVPHNEATTEDMNSFNIQSWVKDLRESMCQVLNSDDLDPNYKKLYDALVKMVQTEELRSAHEEKDMIIVLLCFVLAAIVGGLVGFFLFLDARSAYYGPPPT